MVHLLRVEEEYRLELREIRFDSSMLKQIIQNGDELLNEDYPFCIHCKATANSIVL